MRRNSISHLSPALLTNSMTQSQMLEFIKENNKVRKQENENSTKKAIKKTRKQELDQESDQEKRKKLSFFS